MKKVKTILNNIYESIYISLIELAYPLLIFTGAVYAFINSGQKHLAMILIIAGILKLIPKKIYTKMEKLNKTVEKK